MITTIAEDVTTFRTVEEAQAHFDARANLYNDRNVAAILDGLEDDVEIHYGDLPVMHGKREFEPVIRKRLASFTSYTLKKTVRVVQGNVVLTELDIRWEGEASQGKQHRTRGFEILTFRGKRLAKWELVSCDWPGNLP
ncbi:nuclear transport factor 2 family protein [Variovorax boronicumulans]